MKSSPACPGGCLRVVLTTRWARAGDPPNGDLPGLPLFAQRLDLRPVGKRVYKTTPAGDRAMDFSHAGSMGRGVARDCVAEEFEVQNPPGAVHGMIGCTGRAPDDETT